MNNTVSTRLRTRRALERTLALGMALGLLSGIVPRAGATAEPTVPRQIQVALTLRILEYDRALKTRTGSSLVVGVVNRDASELRQDLAGHSAQGVALRPVEHTYRNAEALRTWIDDEGVQFLLLSPDLDVGLDATCTAALTRRIPVLALTRAQFDAGGTLGIVAKAGKPHVVVNLAASKAAGMSLDPKLLQVAEVVR